MFALALAGCQGGGANPPQFNTGTAGPTSATSSQTVTPAGGSVSTTLGTQTVKVIVPAGALSGPEVGLRGSHPARSALAPR